MLRHMRPLIVGFCLLLASCNDGKDAKIAALQAQVAQQEATLTAQAAQLKTMQRDVDVVKRLKQASGLGDEQFYASLEESLKAGTPDRAAAWKTAGMATMRNVLTVAYQANASGDCATFGVDTSALSSCEVDGSDPEHPVIYATLKTGEKATLDKNGFR